MKFVGFRVMSLLTQLNSIHRGHLEYDRKDSRIDLPKARRARSSTATEGEPDTEVNRMDALKVLARALLEELDCLTERRALSNAVDLSLHALVRRFEEQLIRSALVRTGGKQRQAARLLGAKVTTLNAKIRRYGIGVGEVE